MARAYVSKLREEQAEGTRQRVVEGVATVLGRGISELTYPAVAHEARVSLATVQRLFPRKGDLVAGLADHYNRTVGNLQALTKAPEELDFESFLTAMRAVIERTSRVPPGLRAAVLSQEYVHHRRQGRARRLAMMERTLKPHVRGLSKLELRHLRNLMVVLASSAGVTAFSELVGADAAEASDSIEWMIRRLLSRRQRSRRSISARSRSRPANPSAAPPAL